jgi:hypothetical protein
MAANDPSTTPRKLTDGELCGTLRKELDAALSLIEACASRLGITDNREAKAILSHIVDQGKDHAELLLQLIRRLHPEHREPLDQAPQKYCDIVTAGIQSQPNASGEQIAEDYVMPMQLSVGTLFPR